MCSIPRPTEDLTNDRPEFRFGWRHHAPLQQIIERGMFRGHFGTLHRIDYDLPAPTVRALLRAAAISQS
jgi:hypothetical protein